MRLRIDGDTRLLVLTGAGVSAESGVPTFRDANGLWESHPIEEVATPEGFDADPVLVWRFYSERRRKAKTVHPNPGHVALAAAEERMGDRFLLVTQNVDGLHRRAGSRRLVEIHGSLFETRCSVCERDALPGRPRVRRATRRRARSAAARPGRAAPPRRRLVRRGARPAHLRRDRRRSSTTPAPGRLVFLAVGTSGVVYPAAGLVLEARAAGGEAWLVNAEAADNARAFHHFVKGPSGKVLPELFEWA